MKAERPEHPESSDERQFDDRHRQEIDFTMEEIVKNILDMGSEQMVNVRSETKRQIAKEITSMVFEFIEWIRKNCEVSIDAKKWWLFDHKIEIIGEFTDKELFKYWWDNVKNK